MTEVERDPEIQSRARDLFLKRERDLAFWVDNFFAAILPAQWVAAVLLAWWISPYAWEGAESRVHIHVWMALGLGGLIALPAAALAKARPARTSNRYAVAVGQMLMGALLIHLTGGRIEMHFHIFVSLALLAFYCDWKILIVATAVVAADHFLRGTFWPRSVFGVDSANPWRWIEHAAWVVAEVVLLIRSCDRSVAEMREVALNRAGLEATRTRMEATTAELRLAERNYRDIFENSADGIFQVTPEGQFLSVNPALARIHGFGSPAEMMATSGSLIERFELDPERHALFVAEIDERGSVANFDLQMSCKDGERVWVTVNARVVRNQSGGVLYWEGTLRDVTERKLAREALARSEAKYRNLAVMISKTHHVIMICDAKGRIEWANEGFTTLTEYTSEEVIGLVPGSFLQGPGTDRATARAIGVEVRAGRAFRAEILNYSKSGREYWLAIDAHPIHDDQGRLTNFIAIESDVSDRRRAEDALALSEQRFRLALSNPALTICHQDLDLRYTWVHNPRGHLTVDAVVGRTDRELMRPDEAAVLEELKSGILASGLPARAQVRCTLGDEFRVFDYFVEPSRGPDGTNDGISSLALDITERYLVEASLRESEARFRTLADQVPVVIWIAGPDGGTTWFNQYYADLTGVSLEQGMGDVWMELLHPDDREATVRLHREAVAACRPFRIEFRIRCTDGRYRWLLD